MESHDSALHYIATELELIATRTEHPQPKGVDWDKVRPDQFADIPFLSALRDAIMPVAPVDLVFARATMAHVASLIVGGREIVRDGRVLGVDLDAAHAALRENYRAAMPSRAPFLSAWASLEVSATQFYRGLAGCC